MTIEVHVHTVPVSAVILSYKDQVSCLNLDVISISVFFGLVLIIVGIIAVNTGPITSDIVTSF